MEKTKERDAIPEFETLAEIAEFWDTHSTADYDDVTHEVPFEIQLHHEPRPEQAVMLLPNLYETIKTLARARGISPEALVNAWLTEKVLEREGEEHQAARLSL